MPSLDFFLKDTMLAAANPGRKAGLSLTEASSLKYPLTRPVAPVEGVGPKDAAIWNFEPPVIDNGVKISNLTCRVNGLKATMAVCDSIEWSSVSFFSEDYNTTLELPLSTEYLVRNHFLAAGKIEPGTLWTLEANTDQSFELVFAYEYPPFLSSKKPVKLTAENLQTFADLQSLVAVSDPHSSVPNTLRVSGLRIAVVVTLVCGKERNDFDPKGVLGAGRINPMFMVLSNKQLKTVTATVKISRPARSRMDPDTPTEHQHNHGSMTMDGDVMLPEIGAVFFTDKNPSPNIFELISSPDWTDFFDYYEVDPKIGESFVMVYPPKSKPGGEVKDTTGNALEVQTAEQAFNILTGRPSGVKYSSYKVTKVDGQGEFDNVHLAPKMSIPDADLTVHSLLNRSKLLATVDKITMAPFCIHDCLHLHVRWGEGDDDKWNKGWTDQHTPSAKSGAPLVPPNQKVTIKLLTPSSISYTAEATDVAPADWQIFLHHGGSYALSAGGAASGMRKWRNTAGFVSADQAKWALAYWNFRYVVLITKSDMFGLKEAEVFERLKLDAELVRKLRQVGGGQSAQGAAAGGSR